MEQSETRNPSVLIVDDEPDVVQLYETMLDENFRVETATDGREALQKISESTDVVLLDRRMPGMNGDETLAKLRERGYDVPVAMVTAVEPDTDIVDMQFDDYLKKPVQKTQLRKKVNLLVRRARFDEKSREFYRLASKKATLETRGAPAPTESEAYDELVERMDELRADLDQTLDEIAREDAELVFRSV